MSADISDESFGPNGLMRNTHLLDWLESGYGHCKHGSEEWSQSYLDNARAVIMAQDERIRRLLDHIAELEARTRVVVAALYPNVDRLTAIDRLRLYAGDAITFPFDQDDAENVVDAIDASLAALPTSPKEGPDHG